MQDDQDQGSPQPPDSLLPYMDWSEEAQRHIVVRALAHVAANGMPGEHHFYISFRTDQPGVSLPTRLLAQFPHEITIVLQHQFWDLHVEEDEGGFGVGLSFGGVPSKLRVPLSAITAFVDPHAQIVLRFRAPGDVPADDLTEEAALAPEPVSGLAFKTAAEAPVEGPTEPPQVVSLDAFRRRPPTKD